jgi:hypothetical protein
MFIVLCVYTPYVVRCDNPFPPNRIWEYFKGTKVQNYVESALKFVEGVTKALIEQQNVCIYYH